MVDSLRSAGYNIFTTTERTMAKKNKTPKRRNAVVMAMMIRSAKAGRHTDKRKQASKKACRGRVHV